MEAVAGAEVARRAHLAEGAALVGHETEPFAGQGVDISVEKLREILWRRRQQDTSTASTSLLMEEGREASRLAVSQVSALCKNLLTLLTVN